MSPGKELPASCPVCSFAGEAEHLYRKSGCPIVRCSCCSLVRVAPESGLAESARGIYSGEYFEGGRSDGYANYGHSEETLRGQARQLLMVLRRYAPEGFLLEVGCAYGFFLMEASRYYCVRGIEISPHAAAEAVRRGLDVFTGDILSAPLPDSPLDVVCLFDCIEHLAEPVAAMERIHGAMREGAILALTTGDIRSIFARICGSRWRLMTPPQHLFFFSARTIRLLLEKTGFEVASIRYPWKIVPWSLMLYQVSPSLHRMLGRLGKVPLGIPVNLFDAMLVIARKPGTGSK